MTLIGRVVLSIVAALATLQPTSCYNVDTQVPVVKSGPANSAFGLQVKPFVDDNGVPQLVVGAPQAVSATLGQRAGAVFTCEVLDDCKEIPNLFDKDEMGGNQTVDQLLGQAITITGQNQNVKAIVCAPLFKRHITTQGTYLPIGQCFTLDGNLRSPVPFYPLDDMGREAKGKHRIFMAGQSTVLEKNLATGAPGAFTRQGTIIRANPDDTSATSYYDDSRVIQDCRVTRFCPQTYIGYSLGFGKITETLLNAYVTGAPKENDMTGTAMVIKVENGDIVEDDQLDFNGDQFGSYFGHAVCVVDLNGDSFDEVIVGAPYYAVESHGSEQGRNNGQITIHRPKTEEDPLKIYGKYLDGYFGMAVAAIGDINRDGYQDIAVGAPGELQGKGRIYIYLGHEFTYITKVAQTIDGSDVSSFTPKFFGYTISGGVDMDNNSYPDVIVGSYASDKVWLLRSRPIITMHARMTFNPRTIDVESRNCSKWSFSQSPVACFKADIKMWYESKVPNVKPPETADVGYNLTLDFNHPSQYRLRFSDNDHSKTDTVQMTYGKKTKLILDIYVTPSIKDKESNFDIKFSYFSPVMAPEMRVPGQLQKLFPLVDNDDLEDEQIITSKISVLKLCENNAVCRPHLVATANLTYINNGSALGNVNFIAAHGYGKYDRPFLKLHIAVENKGESAYDSSVVVTLPDKLRFKQAVIPEGTRVTCHLREKIHADYVGVSHVDCSIGNPVFKNEKKKMDFYLTNLFVGNEGQLEIVVNATSNGDNYDQGDDRVRHVPFNVRAYSVLSGSGFFSPRQTIKYITNVNALNESSDPLEGLGPRVLHVYNITNDGPSTIENLHLSITWPLQDPSGADLLYLYAVEIEGDKTYQCDKDYIDLHGFQLNSTQMRRKRSTIPSSYRSTNAVGCREDENYCVEINCTLKSSVPANADIKVVLYARLVAKTVAKYTEAPPTAASRLVAWFNSSYFYNPRPFTATVRSRLSPDQVEEYFDCVPVWVVIGSVIGGVVILAIIILILFYCGFFKTKRHGSMTVTADKEIHWKTAAPTLQTPEGGTVASETVTNNNEYRTDKPSYENHPMHEHEALRSESEESDDSVKKMPLNGTEQTTV